MARLQDLRGSLFLGNARPRRRWRDSNGLRGLGSWGSGEGLLRWLARLLNKLGWLFRSNPRAARCLGITRNTNPQKRLPPLCSNCRGPSPSSAPTLYLNSSDRRSHRHSFSIALTPFSFSSCGLHLNSTSTPRTGRVSHTEGQATVRITSVQLGGKVVCVSYEGTASAGFSRAER
jgi:hypothetical protein